MDIREALDIVVARTHHVRFRELCDPDHPDYNPAYIPAVIAMAEGYDARPADPPSLLSRAVAFGKAVVSHALEGLPNVDDAEFERRMAICRACEFFDDEKDLCTVCGCHTNIKLRWADQACPKGKW